MAGEESDCLYQRRGRPRRAPDGSAANVDKVVFYGMIIIEKKEGGLAMFVEEKALTKKSTFSASV